MKKVIFIVLIIVVIVGGILLYNFFNGSNKMLNETEEAVYNYLINNKGYEKSDIKSIRPEYSWLDEKRNSYFAFVIFNDEPENEYLYIYDKDEGIRERGTNSPNAKH